MKTSNNNLILLFALIGSTSYGQIVFDLAEKKNTTETISSNLKPELIFKNLNPSAKYSFDINMEKEEVSPFAINAFQGSDLCEETDQSTKDINAKLSLFLKEETNEEDIAKLKKDIQSQIDKLPASGADCRTKASEIINKSIIKRGLQFSLEDNQTITVIVKKMNKKDSVLFTWKKVFKTKTKTPWSIMYGFTFVPNALNPVSNYFVKADTSGKSYTITKSNSDRNDFWNNISPTIMFQWTPSKKHTFNDSKGKGWALLSNNFYQLGLTGGLSLNFAKETGSVNVMLGPSIVFANNLSLSTGIALTQKSVLKGNYKEGDVVKENLDFEQLHEKKYLAEYFVSLAFRFDQNPFKKEEGK